MSKRGLQLGAEFRYLGETYLGDARGEILPNDRQADREPPRLLPDAMRRRSQRGWGAALNVNRVSDDQLLHRSLDTRRGDFTNHAAGRCGCRQERAVGRRRQLHVRGPVAELANAAVRPARAGPAALQPKTSASRFNAFRQEILAYRLRRDLGVLRISAIRRSCTADALFAYPSFSLPLQTSYSFLVPKVGAHVTRYAVDANTQGFTDQTRTLPIATADAGLIFERDTLFSGIPFIQTLEPRLYYVYIPFRDQSRIPNFESGPLDVTFATLFTGEPVQRPGPHQRREPDHAGRAVALHPSGQRHRAAAGGGRAALLLPGTARDVAGCRAAARTPRRARTSLPR